MTSLTDRQYAALAVIMDYVQDRGYPPTIRELGAELGIGTLRGVTHHLDALERKGYIHRDPVCRGAIKVLKNECGREIVLRFLVKSEGGS